MEGEGTSRIFSLHSVMLSEIGMHNQASPKRDFMSSNVSLDEFDLLAPVRTDSAISSFLACKETQIGEPSGINISWWEDMT